MDEDLRQQVELEAEKAALFNAVKHDSDAQVDAILGPLLGKNPSFREHADEVPDVVAPIVARVNDLGPDDRRERLHALAPDLAADLEADTEAPDHPLPDLPNADGYDQIRMRLAPNPNGPWHLGNARMPAVVGTYKERYDGWMLCRFDDTDPETKRPDLDAYDSILESIEYLGFEPDEVALASDRLEVYYDHARELIDQGGAYTCTCPAEAFSERKNAGEPCPHRERDPSRTHAEFEGMVSGEYGAGEMVLRVRTAIDHPNPALRDWVAFRILETPHPRPSAADYRCWPMLDFQSGIDDHEFGISHIIRGIDLQDSAKRQEFLYDALGWAYPEVVHWGRIQVDEYDVELSTSTIKRLIEGGDLEGWDDPRAPTVASLRRRGIQGAAIVDAMVGLGTSTSNVDLAMSTVYAANRELIDDRAPRGFLVRNGREKALIGAPETGAPPVHPDHPDRGRRSIPVGDTVLLEPEDVPANGGRVWLKGLGCVRHTRDALEFLSDDLAVVRDEGVPVVHWVPAEASIPLTLRTMDGDVFGRAEPELTEMDTDAIIQFERVGFARIDHLPTNPSPDRPAVAYFAHR